MPLLSIPAPQIMDFAQSVDNPELFQSVDWIKQEVVIDLLNGDRSVAQVQNNILRLISFDLFLDIAPDISQTVCYWRYIIEGVAID